MIILGAEGVESVHQGGVQIEFVKGLRDLRLPAREARRLQREGTGCERGRERASERGREGESERREGEEG